MGSSGWLGRSFALNVKTTLEATWSWLYNSKGLCRGCLLGFVGFALCSVTVTAVATAVLLACLAASLWDFFIPAPASAAKNQQGMWR